jgi:hypothetical protein
MAVEAAIDLIRATPTATHSQFAKEIWRLRREHRTDKIGGLF